jgi:hypothetical protein
MDNATWWRPESTSAGAEAWEEAERAEEKSPDVRQTFSPFPLFLYVFHKFLKKPLNPLFRDVTRLFN